MKFLVAEGIRAVKIRVRLPAQIGDETVKKPTVSKWCWRFKETRTSVTDDGDNGGTKPNVVITATITCVEKRAVANRRVAARKVEHDTELSIGSIQTILHDHLHLRQMAARWVPKHLSLFNMEIRLCICEVQLGDAILSTNDVHNQNFMAPGVAVNLNMALCCLLSAAGIIWDRESGSVKRAGVSGMNGWEYLTGFILGLQFCLIIQLLGMILTLYLYLSLPVFLSFPWMLLLLFIQGIMGQMYGVLIAVITPNINGVVFIVMGTILPMLLSSGTLWPLEGVSYIWLRWICWTMPTTWATEATRSMMLRGWGITYFGVWMGFVSIFAWAAIFLISAVLIMKYSKTKRLFF